MWFTSAAPRLHFFPPTLSIGADRARRHGERRSAPRQAATARAQCPWMCQHGPRAPRLWRGGQADPGEYLMQQQRVSFAIRSQSPAWPSLQPRIESVLQVLSIAASLPCAPGRRRPASVIGLPMPTFCFPLPDTIYWHGLNFFSFSASTTPAIRPTASTPSS